MPTRNVVLTDHQSEMIDRLVSDGRYQNASEVLREGLRLVEARDQEHDAKIQALREAGQKGLDDIAAGRFTRFTNPDDLVRHMDDIADKAIAEWI